VGSGVIFGGPGALLRMEAVTVGAFTCHKRAGQWVIPPTAAALFRGFAGVAQARGGGLAGGSRGAEWVISPSAGSACVGLHKAQADDDGRPVPVRGRVGWVIPPNGGATRDNVIQNSAGQVSAAVRAHSGDKTRGQRGDSARRSCSPRKKLGSGGNNVLRAWVAIPTAWFADAVRGSSVPASAGALVNPTTRAGGTQ
jgi:hypothetical protein